MKKKNLCVTSLLCLCNRVYSLRVRVRLIHTGMSIVDCPLTSSFESMIPFISFSCLPATTQSKCDDSVVCCVYADLHPA